MSWGTLQVGRLYLRETYNLSHQVNATTGSQGVTITGQESMPPWTEAQVRARQEDLMSMLDSDLPMMFSAKANHTGFYQISDIGTDITDWPEAEWFTWNLSCQRIGTSNAIDMESRLAQIIRTNSFALTGERTHAPAVGHYGYYTGTSQPSGSVNRTLADTEGTVKVYRGIPDNAMPQWGITAPNYLKGRARFLSQSQERTGVGFLIADSADWLLSNGLIKVGPLASLGVLQMSVYNGTSWSAKNLDVTVGSALTPPFDAVTVIRNDLEACTVRLIRDRAPGRVTLDLTVRRGSRIIEGVLKSDTSATLGVNLHTTEVTTNNAATGYVVVTSNDAAGNKTVMGSPITFTGSTTGAMSKATSTTFSFFIGSVIAGTSAVSGDAATDLRNQYIAMGAEQTVAVKR